MMSTANMNTQETLHETAPAQDAAANRLAEMEAARAFVRGKRFVIVEDDAMFSEALCGALTMLGGKVDCFDSAELALQHPAIADADCYIVDYMLNGDVDGINFLLSLQQKRQKPVCAVMLSGNTSHYFVRMAEFFDCPVLHKPVSLSKLILQLSDQYDHRA